MRGELSSALDSLAADHDHLAIVGTSFGAERRIVHGLSSTVITHPTAGHRTVLPGEHEIEGGLRIDRGGSPPADRELGQRAWPAIRSALRLR